MGDVNTFFTAKNFAVVGASRDENKVGHVIFKNLLKSDKQIFPVNPKAEKILNHKAYQDILEIPHEIDCVIIAVPSKMVPLILRQAQKIKVKSAVILSAGFSEIGETQLEQRIIQIAKEASITLLGPNSYGFIDTSQNINTTYFEGTTKKGAIAFISQSGAIGSAILDKEQKLSGFVSIGNSAQLDSSDFIEYYSKDENTKVITLYLESLKPDKGKRFIEICKKCKKPIIILKAGKSKVGQKAAQSHTAALASQTGIYSGIFKQIGAIEVNSIKQLFEVANILEKYDKLGNKTTIITNAGGLGVIASDACEENNISIPPLSKNATDRLNKVLSENWSHNNPIDLIGDASAQDYEQSIQIMEKENTDFFIILLTPQRMTESLKTAKALMKTKKPVFACFLGKTQVKEAKEFMDRFGIANFEEITEICKTIGKTIQK